MTEQEKFKFLSLTQGRKLLAAAGVVIIEASSPRVLRWPSASTSKLYITLYRLGSERRMLSEVSLRHEVELGLARLGIFPSATTLASAIGSKYACFLGVSTAAGRAASGDSSQAVLLEAAKELHTLQASLEAATMQSAGQNMQFSLLQNVMQRENQVYSTTSNVLKTRRDTAKNSIDNVR